MTTKIQEKFHVGQRVARTGGLMEGKAGVVKKVCLDSYAILIDGHMSPSHYNVASSWSSPPDQPSTPDEKETPMKKTFNHMKSQAG